MSLYDTSLGAICSDVNSCELPQESTLSERICDDDFIDCYSVEVDVPVREAAEVITTFPGWANYLMKIRNIVVSRFGLSADGPAASDKLGAFPVESETEIEIIAGFDDKHLDFRVSVMSLNGHVYLATWVHCHNIGGRLYLRFILPFHIVIAREALVRVRCAL